MQILWYLIELSATLFENYVVLHSLNTCFPQRTRYKTLPFIGALLLITGYVTLINQFHVFEGFLSTITIALCILYGLVFRKGKPMMKIILVLISFSLILAINITIANIIAVIQQVNVYSESSGARLIALFLTKFLFYIAMRIVVKLFKKEQFTMKLSELLVTLALFVLTHIIAISLIIMQFDDTHAEELTYISILSILLTDILIFYIMRKISRDNQKNLRISLLELQLSEQKHMARDAGQLSKEIKKAEHDLKHHLMSLLGIIEENNSEQAAAYIKQLLKDYETSIFKYVSLDNSAISSVLNFKLSRCRANGIDCKLQIETDFEGFVDTDICVLLSNLLDNAIEASQNVQEHPMITLTIQNKNNYLCIIVSNRITESVLAKNAELKTTKPNHANHGLGLYSISQIVEKYEGIKNYYEEGDFFVADIWLKQSIIPLSERIKNEANYQTRQNQYQTRQIS